MSHEAPDTCPDEKVREQAAAWLARLRSNDDTADHAAFETWYAADLRHADAYDALLDNWETMGLAARTPAAEDRRGHEAARSGRSRLKLAWVATAAAVLVVFSTIGLYRAGLFVPGASDPTHVASPIGEIRAVTLSDGSRVVLDTATAIAIDYTRGQRRLTLQHGRARFEVAHDASRPFVVAAGSGTVVAHGTIFDVDLQGRRVTVALLRGLVEVRSAGRAGSDAGTRQWLRPGEQLALDRQAPSAAPAPLAADQRRWPSGMLSFENAALGDVVASANRYAASPIILDGSVAGLRFTGTFVARDTQAFAQMAAAMFDLDLAAADNGTLHLAPAAHRQKKIPG